MPLPHLIEPAQAQRSLRTRDEAEHYVASVCFKTGPPTLTGVEIEHTVHHADDPGRRLSIADLTRALGSHAPATLDPDGPNLPLPAGGTVTVEPGGQVEISTTAHRSLRSLHTALDIDLRCLGEALAAERLTIGHNGLDPHRDPQLLIHSPRYDAMAHAFARHGPDGLAMMGATAGLQVCLDAGTASQLPVRWRALHDAGPVLLALFSTSRGPGRHHFDGACARMHTWWNMDGGRTHPVNGHRDPAIAWARYAMRAEVLCMRRDGESWRTPGGVSFADWIEGAWPQPPTVADLDYHLSTLFPPVRPRGYLEVRYLDTQPPDEWLVPVAVISALFANHSTVDVLSDLCAPVAGRWLTAATAGLADPQLAATATAVAELACQSLCDTDLTSDTCQAVTTAVDKRLAAATT